MQEWIGMGIHDKVNKYHDFVLFKKMCMHIIIVFFNFPRCHCYRSGKKKRTFQGGQNARFESSL